MYCSSWLNPATQVQKAIGDWAMGTGKDTDVVETDVEVVADEYQRLLMA
jgi:hypothetical protein